MKYTEIALAKIPMTLMSVGAAGLAIGAVIIAAPPAGAAYLGTNADVAFVSTRSDNVAIYQVSPSGASIGTSSGDEAATSQLTDGSDDAEPFYSPDGQTLYFSSDRTGNWEIYSIPQSSTPLTSTSTTDVATEISQGPSCVVNLDGTNEPCEDYTPSVGPDGQTVVFNRDNTTLYTLYASKGISSECPLYTPPDGLLSASSDNGAGSRPVFDPVDASKLLYVDASGHLHLLSGLPTPSGTNPCSVSASSLTDVDLSAIATPTSSNYALPTNASADDADPDWNPSGTAIVFDSRRGGGRSLFVLSDPTGTPTIAPLFPSQAVPGGVTAIEPVYSPDGTEIAYVEPEPSVGTQVDVYVVSSGTSTEVSLDAGKPANSQPDWQSITSDPGDQTPEAPIALMLPGSAVLIFAGALGLRRRRRLSA